MSKAGIAVFVLAIVIASCSAEAPRFRKANFRNRQFQFFLRQEEAPVVETEIETKPADAPYPPSGITPENPLELPTETTIAPQPAQEYGPPAAEEAAAPAQEYGPPDVEEAAVPAQEYGPPDAAEEPAVLVEEETADEVLVEEQEVVEVEPEAERLIVYRVPSARLIRRRPVARYVQLKH